MREIKSLTASQESYLLAIYKIVEEKKAARVKDISKSLDIGPSSVSEALKLLGEKGIINYAPYELITLTAEGEALAQELNKRRNLISSFLSNVLSIEKDKSEISAKKIEHAITGDVLDKFVMFLSFMQSCPCKEPKWMKGFQEYSKNDELSNNCKKCMTYCQDNNLTKPISKGTHQCCGIN